MLGAKTRSRSVVDAGRVAHAVVQWRGRASELADAGRLPWSTVMTALELPPDDWATDGNPLAALGFVLSDLRTVAIGDDVGGVRLSGRRHRRQVEVRVGQHDHGWSPRPFTTTWLRVESPTWSVTVTADGTVAASSPLPGPIAEALLVLSPAGDTWRGLHLRGGPEGIVAHRQMRSHSHAQAYLYDLWLVERLAASVGAPALPSVQAAHFPVPYGLD